MTGASDAAAGSRARDALYVFGVANANLLTIDHSGVNVEDRLELVPFGDLVAVAATVRVDDFCGPAAEARLKDPTWISVHACHHEAVVERVMRTSPIVPARFATLFSSRANLVEWLNKHHTAISDTLDQVAGHEEWAVKGALEKQKAEARLLVAALERERGTLSTSPGARYLKEQRLRAGVGQELEVWLKQVRDRAAAALLAHAAQFRERIVIPGSWVGEGIGILNWAFLVARPRGSEFEATVRGINQETGEHGFLLTVSGPWPPYSFCPPLEATEG